MNNTYKIGGKTIEINSVHNEVHELCREYRYSGIPDFKVITEQKNIDYEREKSAIEDMKENITVREFPDSYLETLAVYRKIADYMLNCNTLLFHGSVVAVDGKAYLFTAKSGTGKSTHTRLWREYFGKRAVMVNDDKPLIQVTENGIIVHGTPWDGKHHLNSNISVPLKAVCILTRAVDNYIEKLSKPTAYPMLLQQSYRPESAGKMKKVLHIINSIADGVPLYRAGCNMEREAVETTYNAMKG